jgi:hypothetical protein
VALYTPITLYVRWEKRIRARCRGAAAANNSSFRMPE